MSNCVQFLRAQPFPDCHTSQRNLIAWEVGQLLSCSRARSCFVFSIPGLIIVHLTFSRLFLIEMQTSSWAKTTPSPQRGLKNPKVANWSIGIIRQSEVGNFLQLFWDILGSPGTHRWPRFLRSMTHGTMTNPKLVGRMKQDDFFRTNTTTQLLRLLHLFTASRLTFNSEAYSATQCHRSPSQK